MQHEYLLARLVEAAIAYNTNDPKRSAHLLKVHGFARTIGLLETLDSQIQFTLEAAAIVHDIGIRICEQKYNGRCSGDLQQREGPAVAKQLLDDLNFPKEITMRVCYLVAHHHTYTNIDGIDYQILVEADFLVNIYEEEMKQEAIEHVKEKIFKTEAGKRLLKQMFGSVQA